MAVALLASIPAVPPAAGLPVVCPADQPIQDTFYSEGLFIFSNKTMGGDAVRLVGPTTICREPVAFPDSCWTSGFATAPLINTTMVRMDLAGISTQGVPITVQESPALDSTGTVGPIPLTCDSASGTATINGTAPSTFDVFVLVNGVLANEAPFVVSNDIPGLPADPSTGNLTHSPDNITAAQPPNPYRHASGSVGLAGPGGIVEAQADEACHAAFFVPIPGPMTCGGTEGVRVNHTTIRDNPYTIVVVDVSANPLLDVSTTNVTYNETHFSDVTVSDWTPAIGGVWRAAVDLTATGSAPSCASGDYTTITVNVNVTRVTETSGATIETNWCNPSEAPLCIGSSLEACVGEDGNASLLFVPPVPLLFNEVWVGSGPINVSGGAFNHATANGCTALGPGTTKIEQFYGRIKVGDKEKNLENATVTFTLTEGSITCTQHGQHWDVEATPSARGSISAVCRPRPRPPGRA